MIFTICYVRNYRTGNANNGWIDYNYGKGLQNYDTSGGYLSNARHAAAAATMRDELGGGIMGGIGANALGVLNELSGLARGVVAEGHELIGGPKHSFINTLGQTGEDLYANLYGSLYGKSGGAGDVYADMINQLSANKGTGFKGFLEQGLAAQAEANKKYTPNTLTLADLISKTPNKVTAMGPNYNYGSAQAAEVPIKKNNRILPRRKPDLPPTWSMTDDLEAQNIRPTFDSSDEEQDYYNQIRNKIGKMPTIKDPNIFQRFRNRFYKPATSAARGYNVSQLNKMNALGGYYSEPARQQRRMDARRTNILNRAAKGKAVGNVNQLLGKYGYTGTPGSGTLQFTGQAQGNPNAGAGYSRSDDSWSSSTFRRGGLASLWQR